MRTRWKRPPPRLPNLPRQGLLDPHATQPQPRAATLPSPAAQGVLAEIRPFLKMAGGTVEMTELVTTGIAPKVELKISGSGNCRN